jgi:hypothetical protein
MMQIYQERLGAQTRAPSRDMRIPTADNIREEAAKMKSERLGLFEKQLEAESVDPFGDLDAFQ